MTRIFLIITGIIASSALAYPNPAAASLSGGDGSSFAKAIVVKAPSQQTGVNAQYDYIAKHFGRCRAISVKTAEHGKRIFDVMTFTTTDGKTHILYFDATDYYAKS